MYDLSWSRALPEAQAALEQPPLVRASDRPSTLRGCAAEFASHTSPRLLLLMLPLLLAVRLAVGQWSWLDLLLPLLFVLYQPFNEWLTHVFVLHAKPILLFGRSWETSLSWYHRRHHQDPWRVDYTLLPPAAFGWGTLVHLGLPLLILPWPQALTWYATSIGIGLFYEWIHYLTHTSYRPTSAWMKRRTRLHRLHHFKNEQYWQGVTSDIADLVLRTEPDARSVPTSPLARDLGRVAG